MSKIRPSMVGEWERVMDSVQPVHSWNGNQITDGRLTAAGAAASRFRHGAAPRTGASAIMDAKVAQYFEEGAPGHALPREGCQSMNLA
jgi:hypothetical protein